MMALLAFVLFSVITSVSGLRRYTYIQDLQTRDGARTLCQDRNLELAVMTSSDDTRKVLDVLSGISLTSDVWLDLTYDGTRHVWPGGHEASWSDWKNVIEYDTPDDPVAEPCVLALKPNAQWSARDCLDDQYDSLCYDPVVGDYEVISSPVEYVDAVTECNDVNKLMPKMTSNDDVKQISELWEIFAYATHFWIGLKYNGSHYVWFDDTLPTWLNWDSNQVIEPIDPETKTCVVIDRVTRSWATRDCSATASVLCYDDNPEASSLLAADSEIMTPPESTVSVSNPIECGVVCKTATGCTHYVIDENVCKIYSVASYSLNTGPKVGARIWKIMLNI